MENETKTRYIPLPGDIVSITDDRRFKGRVLEINFECQNHADCYIVLISWHAGNTAREHSKYIELTERPETDKACQVFTIRTLNMKWDKAENEARNRALGNQPYLVIGDYAYVLGHDGVIWMAPAMSYRSDKRVRWDLSVDLDESVESYFPYSRLVSLLGDFENITDIMRQMDISIGTVLI